MSRVRPLWGSESHAKRPDCAGQPGRSTWCVVLAGAQLEMAIPGPVLERGVSSTISWAAGSRSSAAGAWLLRGCGDQECVGGDGARDDDLCDIEGLLSRIMP